MQMSKRALTTILACELIRQRDFDCQSEATDQQISFLARQGAQGWAT